MIWGSSDLQEVSPPQHWYLQTLLLKLGDLLHDSRIPFQRVAPIGLGTFLPVEVHSVHLVRLPLELVTRTKRFRKVLFKLKQHWVETYSDINLWLFANHRTHKLVENVRIDVKPTKRVARIGSSGGCRGSRCSSSCIGGRRGCSWPTGGCSRVCIQAGEDRWQGSKAKAANRITHLIWAPRILNYDILYISITSGKGIIVLSD